MKYAACEKCAKSVGAVNVIVNTLMILIKAYMGLVGGSKGMIADACHSCADLLATLVMIVGMKISDQKADKDYPYGYGKAEYIVAILIYVFLFLIGTYIIIDAVLCIMHRNCVQPNWYAFWGTAVMIIMNEILFRHNLCAGTQTSSPAMVAKAWESRSDVYSSIGVLIGILGARMGFRFMDSLAAIVVGIIILKICIEYIKVSIEKLMDAAPDEAIIKNAGKALESMKNILGVKKILAREVGKIMEFEVLLSVPAQTTVADCEEIKAEARKALAGSMSRKIFVRVLLEGI